MSASQMKYTFPATHARCTICGDVFGDGEEVYMQGGAIWHPRCGPEDESEASQQQELNQRQGLDDEENSFNLANTCTKPHLPNDHLSRRCYSSMSTVRSRSVSPFSSYSQYGRSRSPGAFIDREPIGNDLNRIYTTSYLTGEPGESYLKKPLGPRPPKSPQFHRPNSASAISRRKAAAAQSRAHHPRQGMQVLVDQLQSSTPRARSPHMNNEEPIQSAHYPDGRKPGPREIPRIERDDFPAPPFAYTDRHRHWSESSKDNISDIVDGEMDSSDDQVEDDIELNKIKNQTEELSKISTGIGKVFLETVRDREKLRAWKQVHVDPRNASRMPSAKSEMHRRLRYENPVNASPSRAQDRPKPWEEDEIDRGSVFINSAGKSTHVPPALNNNVVSASRYILRPGYGMRAPSSGRTSTGVDSPGSSSKLHKTQSVEFSSVKSSDLSPQYEMPENGVGDKRSTNSNSNMNGFGSNAFPMAPLYSHPPEPRFGGGQRRTAPSSYSSHLRRSMPNVNALHCTFEPPKLYPYYLLVTTNYKMPPDVDRCHLERHLSNDEFQAIFHMSRLDFYRAPEWKRNELKRRSRLF